MRPIHLLDCLIHNLYKAIVNLQRVRYFVVVPEELNFTRAAERLHMAHSLLSYQIRQLEDEPEGGERLTALRGAGSQA
jgi:Bacterial regulatory helix-turn-helix protein, lysR family